MTAVIASILTLALIMVHATLTQSARDVAVHRLDAVAGQLATVYGNLFTAGRTRIHAVALDPAVVQALMDARRNAGAISPDAPPVDSGPATARLARLLNPTDTGLTAELWTADGRRIAHVGRDLRANLAVEPATADPGSTGLPHDGFEGLGVSDSVEFGRLYLANGGVYLWAIAPVMNGATRIGYVTRQYRLSNSGQIEQFIRGLTDTNIGLYLRNTTGEMWSTISGGDAGAPTVIDSSEQELLVSRPGVGDLLAVEQRIAGAPLALVVEVPLASVLADTRGTLTKLAVLGFLLTVVGAIVSWRVSRRFTTPLASLTHAAEAFAAGDFGTRVRPQGGDELVRLAAGFNRMVEEVGASRADLEMQTAEAEAARSEAERTRLQAEAANRAKSDFLRVMSHELRTPLNAIGGYTELMELELRGPITDEQRRDLGRIRASQQHLLGLISGVLDLSRIESGRVTYQIEPLAIDPFLAAIDDLVGPQAQTKLVTLEYVHAAHGLGVLADAEKLRQIMLNLISNAIRHTPPEGRITLSAEAVGPSTVAITVHDTGFGIAEDALERIFEPFVQLDRTLTSDHEGLGLGLSISRDLARGMGGDLTVESRVGAGASFRLTLPRAEVADPTIRPRSGEHPVVERRPVG
jgi:signal transduction histidine kinase